MSYVAINNDAKHGMANEMPDILKLCEQFITHDWIVISLRTNSGCELSNHITATQVCCHVHDYTITNLTSTHSTMQHTCQSDGCLNEGFQNDGILVAWNHWMNSEAPAAMCACV